MFTNWSFTLSTNYTTFPHFTLLYNNRKKDNNKKLSNKLMQSSQTDTLHDSF